jgi:hypothetical protein
MAASGEQASDSRLSFLPKLLLWGLVLLFGYLYLGAVERSEQLVGQSAPGAADTMAQTGGTESPSAGVTTTPDRQPAAAAQPAAGLAVQQPTQSEPVRAAASPTPPAAQATAEPPAPPRVAEPMPAPTPTSMPAPIAAPAPQSQPVTAQPSPATPEDKVTKAEAAAFAQAVMSEEATVEDDAAEAAATTPPAAASAPTPAQPAAAPAQPAAAQPPARAPVAPPAMAAPRLPQPPAMPRAAPASQPGVQQGAGAAPVPREELMKQYEAMRKQAMEDAQKRWQQYYGNRPPMPMGAPPVPMYPGYAPGRMPAPAPAPAAPGGGESQ